MAAAKTTAKAQTPTEKLGRVIRTDYRTDLTEALPELMQPFTLAVVKFKPLTKPFNKGGKQHSTAAFYMDSRMVGERLNHVVGAGGWSDDYRELTIDPRLGLPIECSLSVLGVTKRDVGQIAPGNVDEKAFKSAYSDAFKRAAVKFGIGLYLYKIPRVTAEVNVSQNGKVTGFTFEGQKFLRGVYEKWLAAEGGHVFGEPLDHGDPLPELIDEVIEEPTPAPPQPTLGEGDRAATEDEVATLLEMAGQIGGQAKEATEKAIAKNREAHGGAVSGKWLGDQVAKAMKRLNPTGGDFEPHADASREPTGGDVAQAFEGAAA